MAYETQTDVEDPLAPADVAQDAPLYAPAPEVGVEEMPAVDPVPASGNTTPAEVIPDETDETDETEEEPEPEERVHNPNALRGVPAGPPPHPRSVN